MTLENLVIKLQNIWKTSKLLFLLIVIPAGIILLALGILKLFTIISLSNIKEDFEKIKKQDEKLKQEANELNAKANEKIKKANEKPNTEKVTKDWYQKS